MTESLIVGAHSIIYSRNPDADRALLRDVLKLPHVDVGGGWLIFGLPPAEVAVHPSERNDVHEFYLMCDDIQKFTVAMQAQDVACGPVRNEGWGMLTELRLPGGGKIGVYQPLHPRPNTVSGARAKAKSKGATSKTRTSKAKSARKPSKPKKKGR